MILITRVICSWLLVSVCSAAASQASTLKSRRSGAVLFEPKAQLSQSEQSHLQKVLKKLGLKIEKKILNGKIHLAKQAALGQLARTEEELADQLMKTGALRFAEPDYLEEPDQVPNDPLYSSYQWHHTLINSPGAWEMTTGQYSVLAAVCDSGVEYTHPDLAPNLVLPGFNTVDNSTNATPAMRHGTMVAGFLGAVGNNGLGVAGAAWNVGILPVRITNNPDGTAYLSDMAECVRYAADRGAKVVNMSYSGASASVIDSAAQYLRTAGGILFMSAGNSGADISSTYPDYDSIVLVGATTSTDTRAAFSNFGTAVDIVAPGQSVATTYSNGSYATGNGTSYASPIAAGVAALIYSLNPRFAPEEVEDMISSTAVDLGDEGEDSVFGFGRIDAASAVAKAWLKLNTCVQASPTVSISASNNRSLPGGSATYVVTVTNNDSEYCKAGTFSLALAQASEWVGAFSSPELDLLPGQTAKTQLLIEVPASVTPGTYPFGVETTHGDQTGEARSTIDVVALEPLRIDSGASTLSISSGTSTGDRFYSGGSSRTYSGERVENTEDDSLYQSVRYGSQFGYSLDLPNGTYLLRLHFADFSYSSAGQRRMDVLVNGMRALSDLDIVAVAGGGNRALVIDVPVAVNGGKLNLSFVSTFSGRNATISGIEIVQSLGF